MIVLRIKAKLLVAGTLSLLGLLPLAGAGQAMTTGEVLPGTNGAGALTDYTFRYSFPQALDGLPVRLTFPAQVKIDPKVGPEHVVVNGCPIAAEGFQRTGHTLTVTAACEAKEGQFSAIGITGGMLTNPADTGDYAVELAVTGKEQEAAVKVPLRIAKPVALTLGELTSQYGGGQVLTATLTHGGKPLAGMAVAFAVDGRNVGTGLTGKDGVVTRKEFLPLDAGTYQVTATFEGSTELAHQSATATLVVKPAPLTVTAASSAREYGLPNPVLTGTVTGLLGLDTLTAAYTTAADGASPAGEYAILPVLEGERLANYAVTYKPGVLTVTKAPLTVKVQPASRYYGDPDPEFAARFDGLRGQDQLALTYTTDASVTSPVGAYAVSATVSGEAAANYEIVVTPAAYEVTRAPLTVTPAPMTRLYGEANPALVGSISGLRNGESVGVTYATYAEPLSPAGDYPITAILTGDVLSNYEVAYAPEHLHVAPAPLTILIHDAERAYGGINPDFTFTALGLVGEDTVTMRYQTEATAESPVGAYIVTGEAGGPVAGNYAITVTPGTLTVRKAPIVVTPNTAVRQYGAENPVLTGIVEGVMGADRIEASYYTEASPASPVGAYPILAGLSGAALSNYAINVNPGTLQVTPAPLVIRPHDAVRAYGAINPELTGTIEGLIAGDEVTAAYTTTASPESPVGAYVIVAEPSGPSLGNYAISLANGLLLVEPAPLTVTAAPARRLYGAPNPPFTGEIAGLVNGDELTVTFASSATKKSAVGAYAITAELSGPSLSNYAVTIQPGILTVEKAPLDVQVGEVIREFGQPNPGFYGDMMGLLNNDTLMLVAETDATEASPPGQYKVHAKVEGKAASNYEIHLKVGLLTVVKPKLKVTPTNQTLVYGEQLGELTGTVTGLLKGDEVKVTYSTEANGQSGVGSYAIVATLEAPKALLEKYDLQVAEGMLIVEPATLVVTPKSLTRAVGANNPPLEGTVTGLVKGEKVTVKYETEAQKNSPAGTYPITATINAPEKLLENYEVVLETGTLTIK